jgi:hypothetical protein
MQLVHIIRWACTRNLPTSSMFSSYPWSSVLSSSPEQYKTVVFLFPSVPLRLPTRVSCKRNWPHLFYVLILDLLSLLSSGADPFRSTVALLGVRASIPVLVIFFTTICGNYNRRPSLSGTTHVRRDKPASPLSLGRLRCMLICIHGRRVQLPRLSSIFGPLACWCIH